MHNPSMATARSVSLRAAAAARRSGWSATRRWVDALIIAVCLVACGTDPDATRDAPIEVPDGCVGEACGPCGPEAPDSDADGVADACDRCPLGDDAVDDDADGVPDACDPCPLGDASDADADGVPDACDICDGDDRADIDRDGVPDACDVCSLGDDNADADADGVPDACDVCTGFDDHADADADGAPDGCDSCRTGDDTRDSDRDTVADACDICDGDDRADIDRDGVPDACDPCPHGGDTDADGTCDIDDVCPLDPLDDRDNDGLCDSVDPCPLDPLDDQDRDGTCDSDDACPLDPLHADSGPCARTEACPTGDADADGICNDVDPCPIGPDVDTDSDGVCDSADRCPNDAPDDSDGDGICDSDDPCPGDAPDDRDLDGTCDSDDPCPLDPLDDRDEDGICDFDDPCPDDPTNDADGDGLCGLSDPCPDGDDTDVDGVCDSDDPCPLDPFDDSDSDGACDSDDPCPLDPLDDRDLDGTCDSDDPCPEDNPDDSDGDGVCDSADVCVGGDDTEDADEDGIADDCDICPGYDDAVDTDGDGVADGCDVCEGGDDAIDGDGDGIPTLCDHPWVLAPLEFRPPALHYGARLGYGFDYDDGRLITNGWGARPDGGTASVGAIYVYRLGAGGTVTLETYLTAEDLSLSSHCSTAHAISGDTIVGGCDGYDFGGIDRAGAAFTYDFDGMSWNFARTLAHTAPATMTLFGDSVALDGDYLAVGAGSDDVWMFHRDDTGAWTLTQTLYGALTDKGVNPPMDLQDDELFIGVDRAGEGRGAVRIYRRAGDTWSLAQTLAPPGDNPDRLGRALAVDGDQLIVGAPGFDSVYSASGAVYFAEKVDGNWVLGDPLEPEEPGVFDEFGESVDILGDYAVGGAQDAEGNGIQSGQATVFVREVDGWRRQATLFPPEEYDRDGFGAAVQVTPYGIFVGAWRALSNAGVMFLFRPDPRAE